MKFTIDGMIVILKVKNFLLLLLFQNSELSCWYLHECDDLKILIIFVYKYINGWMWYVIQTFIQVVTTYFVIHNEWKYARGMTFLVELVHAFYLVCKCFQKLKPRNYYCIKLHQLFVSNDEFIYAFWCWMNATPKICHCHRHPYKNALKMVVFKGGYLIATYSFSWRL